MISKLGAALGRHPMYRVVSVVLGGLAVLSVVFAATGVLDKTVFPVDAMLLTLVVLLGAALLTSTILGRVRRTRPQAESAVITALLLWFLYWPASDPAGLAWLALIAALAIGSKYVVVWQARHVFNPAAAGVVAGAVLAWLLGHPDAAPATTWWIASEPLLPWVAVGGIIVLWRIRQPVHAVVFVAVALALTVVALADQGMTTGDALRFGIQSSPIVFFACLMLTEPLTIAPRRHHQVLAAVVAAVVFTLPLTALAAGFVLHLDPIGGTYEVALLAANLIALACGQRGARLEFVEQRMIGDETHEFRFRPRRGLSFVPGQFIELDLGPTNAPGDRAGMRRTLSISSPPGEEITVAVRIGEDPSRFKQALQALAPGQMVRATSRGGDFVLPRDARPVALVAGGIGLTPYLSQLRAPGAADRDVTLVYGTTAQRIPYAEELLATGVPVTVVSPERPEDLPQTWQHISSAVIDRTVLESAIPDLAARRVHLSGPPAMVDALRRAFPTARTDHFSGY